MKNLIDNGKIVSILIISKNVEHTIKRLMDSIFAQTYPNIEIVCIDSSDDSTKSILEEYKRNSKFPFKFIFQEPKGCGVARNTAFNNASGDIITALDSDDYIPVDYIQKLVRPFNEKNYIAGVYVNGMIVSSAKNFFSDFVKLYEDIMLFNDEVFFNKPHKYLIATLREVGEEAGEWDENAEVAEDLIHRKKVIEILEKFNSNGYKLECVDTCFISERQAHTIKDHWKKCMWYAKALVNKNYIKSYKKDSISKICASTYITMLPFMLLILFFLNAQVFVYVVIVMPLLLVMIYIWYKAFLKGIVTWKLFLLPFYIYYRAFFTFIGILFEILRKRA